MEKGEGPPPHTVDTSDISNIPAPPYHGPPLDYSVVTNQSTPVQPAAQHQPVPQPAEQQYPRAVAQQYHQPADQQYPQAVAQQYHQPADQQYPQAVAQQHHQPVAQQYPQIVPQQYHQPVDQQYPQVVAQQYHQQYPQTVVQQYYQPVQQPGMQYIQQQNQMVEPVTQMVVVKQRPTEAAGNMTCPHCKCSVVTNIEHKLGVLTWIIVGVLFIFGFWPCCLIPFCVNSCKDVQHSCPNCNNVLHVYKRM